jgi:uncharacterized protein (DUF2236 family)
VTARDPGLFGPDSVTWRIHGDPAMALGGLRALLLQALHPLAMAAVAQHSTFRTDPWGRLFRTGEYVASVTFGTTAEAEAAAARVRGVHRRLRGVEAESGVAYRVDDPHLLLWVHCSEVDSFLTAYRRCGARLTRADADRYVAEQVRAAALVGVPPEACPDSAAALAAYFTRMRPQLRATAEARAAARFILAPPLPLPARPAWAALAAVAFGLLPPWARRRYGPVGLLTAHPGAGLAAAAAGRSLRALVGLVPPAVRESPARRAARARLAAGGPG